MHREIQRSSSRVDWRNKRLERRPRVPYEFDKSVIDFALERAGWQCETCKRTKFDLHNINEPAYFEVHHLLWIELATRIYPMISVNIIRSEHNAQVLCISCHEKVHREGIDHKKIAKQIQEDYFRVARANV